MERSRWTSLFRRMMGLLLLAALAAPAFSLAAGPYVAKPAEEEADTDWISPVYEILEEEMELPQSAEWQTSGWTVEDDGSSGSTVMLFSYADENAGAFLGNYRTEYGMSAGEAVGNSAMAALEGHLVPALTFIRMMRVTLDYRLAMSDSAVNGYFSGRYSMRVPAYYSGENEEARVDVLPFYFVPQDENGAVLTDYSRQSADGRFYLYLIRTGLTPDGEGRFPVTETLVADQELLGKIFPMLFEQMNLPELSDWLLRTPETWRNERYFAGTASAAALLGTWKTEFGYRSDLWTVEEPWYPMTLELKADGTCDLTRAKAWEGTWNLEENTLRVDYGEGQYLLFDAMDQHLYLTVVGEDGRIVSIHRLRREGGMANTFSISLATAEPREEPEGAAPAAEGVTPDPSTAGAEPAGETAAPGQAQAEPTESPAPAEDALIILPEDGETVLSAGQRVQLLARDASGEPVTGVSWTLTDMGGFDGRAYATINRSGEVTARSQNRKVQIRVKAAADNGLRGEIELTVLPKLKKMSLDKNRITLYMGEEPAAVHVSVTPEEAMPRKLVWTAADEIVAVEPSEDGASATLIPKKIGKTSVTVRDPISRASATVRISVIQPVTGLSISGPRQVQRGKTATYHVSLAPANPSDKRVSWSVDTQNSVAVITTDGVLKVRKAAEPGLIIHLTCTASGAGEPISETIEIKVQ